MSKAGAKGQRAAGTGVSNSARTEAKRDLLVQAIDIWAREELQFKENSLPTPEEFKLLLKDASSIKMWDHLVTCVHSPNTADLARKNLHLHLGAHDTEEARLQARRLECKRELNSLELALAQMEMEISRLRTDIGILAGENEGLGREVGGTSKKKTLLVAHRIKLQEEVQLVKEYTRRIMQRKESFCWPEQETSYFTRARSSGLEGSELELESVCKRDVRETCDLVKELLCILAAADTEQESADDVDRAKAKVWSRVESLLGAHPPASLVHSLCEVSNDTARSLRTTTAALNLTEDAAQLRCGLNQSMEQASLEKGSFLQSVEDHLMEAQLTHLRRCVECKRSQSAARLAQEVLEKAKGEIDGLLWQRLPSDANHENRELLRGVVLQRLDESGCEAMLEMMTQLCAGLESTRTQQRKALSALQGKRDQIDQFSRITEMKQSDIRKLAKLNSAARQKLQLQRSELELYVKKTVCGHEGQLLAVGAGLLGASRVELELFSALDLDRLVKTPGLSTPTCELSVHRLRPHQPSGQASWHGLLSALHLPPYTSPHSVLKHLTSSLEKVESLSAESKYQRHVIDEMKQSSANADSCQGVLRASRDYDSHLGAEGMEAANKSLLLASQALAHCSIVQNTMQEWWEEPGQKCVPWVTRDGMGLSKWLEQWKVLTAKLKQLSNI